MRHQVGRNYVVERYMLADARELQYKQPEGSFSNPNASVCIGTLNWLSDVSSSIEGAKVLLAAAKSQAALNANSDFWASGADWVDLIPMSFRNTTSWNFTAAMGTTQ